MKWRLNQSLRAKVIRLTSAAVLLAMFATVAAVILFEITTFRPRALLHAKAQADLIAEIIVPSLEFDDPATAEKMLTVLRHESAVAAAAIYRADGSRLAQYRRAPDLAEAPVTAPATVDRIEGRAIIISVQVDSGGGAIGRVWLESVLPGWRDRIRQYGLILVLIALAVVVLSLGIAFATRKQITDPLHALSETVQRIGQSGDLQLRVAEDGSGEIGELAHTFNTMLGTLELHDRHQGEREARLVRQNQGLVDMARAQQEAPEDTISQSQHLTEILCEALEVERAGIWVISADGTMMTCRELYERGPRKHTAGVTIQASQYPVYFSAIERERVIKADDALTDPRTVEYVEGYLKPLGIGSMLDVPVRWRDRIAGVLCLEHVGGRRDWQLDEVGFAISAADRVAFYLEVEEAQKAAADLRESEERYRSLIEEARDAIFTLAPDGTILALNHAVESITGWKAELWIGRNFTEPLLPENREMARALFDEVQRGGRPPSFELQIRSRNGTMVTLEFSISPRYLGGQVVGLLGIGRDVTERHLAGEVKAKLEGQLRQAQKMEAIGNLAGGIAHDFNNILTAIIGNAQLAEMDLAPRHPAREFLVQTLAASHRAKELVLQILTFSRRQDQRLVPTALEAVILESLKLLRPVLPSSIEITTRLSTGLSPVLADSTQIHQVVINLATNAAHAMEEAGGRLELTLEEVQVDRDMVNQKPQLKIGRFVRLGIADTGTGMSENTLQRIFEPFFTTKETGKGTGLGLAVVHGIVEQHHGAIVVYSVLGKGTSFQIYFPVGADAPSAIAVSTPGVARPGRNQRVMIIDDDNLVLAVADNILRRAGYRTVIYSDPQEALRSFRANPAECDLVITDLTMPGLKGTKLAAEMRAVRAGLPIILATGFGGGLDTAIIQSAGLHGLLRKPFTHEALLEVVARALEAGEKA